MDWLTAEDVGKMLQLSYATVNRLVDRGELRCVWIGGVRRFTPTDVKAFMDAAPTESPRKRKTEAK